MTRLVAALKSMCLAASLSLLACAPGGADLEDESVEDLDAELSGTVAAGSTLKVTASALNLRSGPSTGTSILTVLAKDDLVTVVTASGGNGWVNVKSANGKVGWVSMTYVVLHAPPPADPGPGTPDPGSFDTCDPERAEGVVGFYQKALHDSIAFAEGTRNHSNDGYDVMFSFKIMTSCGSHPNKCISFGSSCSTAAGRYQFLTGTWNSVKSAQSLTSFEPENQERGGAYLVKTVRKVTVPQDRPMTASEFSNAMNKLSWEWASLPPGRYGQPTKTLSQMRTMYCSLAGC